MNYLWPITALAACAGIACKSVLLRENPFSWKMVAVLAVLFATIEGLLWVSYRLAPGYFRMAFLTEGMLMTMATLITLFYFKEAVSFQHWMGAAFVAVGVFFLIKG